MKRIVIAIFAFVLMMSIGTVNTVYFEKTCREVSSSVEEAIRQATLGEFSTAATTAQNAEHFWEGRRRLLRYTINHGLLYEVDTRITGLAQLSTEDAKEEFLSSAEQVIQAIEYISKNR